MSENINLVLGGTSGLGSEITSILRDQGESVWVLGSSYDPNKHGEGMQVDLSNESSVDDTVTKLRENLAERALASLWIVSGYGYNGDFADQPDPRRMATVNFSGTLPVVQFGWEKMAHQEEGGNLAIVSSTTGERPRADEAIYSATKAAQVMLGRSLGQESERIQSPVSVSLFMPGGMRTPFWDNARPESYDSFNDPKKVAEAIVTSVENQDVRFNETTIERGEYT